MLIFFAIDEVIGEFKAMIPPKTLIGSADKDIETAFIESIFVAIPQGLLCFSETTVVVSLKTLNVFYGCIDI